MTPTFFFQEFKNNWQSTVCKGRRISDSVTNRVPGVNVEVSIFTSYFMKSITQKNWVGRRKGKERTPEFSDLTGETGVY